MTRLSTRYLAYSDIRREEREQRIKAKMALGKPNAMPALLSHQQRETAINNVRSAMDVWLASPFEHEGVARHAVRSAFCLGGAGWAAADQEAGRIVGAALTAMGAKRPSWDEGQPTYASTSDYCHWCHSPNELGAGSRYCSAECAKAASVHRDMSTRRGQDRAYRDVYRAVKRFAAPEIPCIECGKSFHPRVEQGRNQEFCSVQCQSRHTGKQFAENPVAIECEVCGATAFSKGRKQARFCGSRCEQIARRLKNGWQPTRLSSQLFDHFIALPTEAARPKWLTPERFDEMLAA